MQYRSSLNSCVLSTWICKVIQVSQIILYIYGPDSAHLSSILDIQNIKQELWWIAPDQC